VRSLPQNGQIARGYQCGSLHAVQRLIKSLPWVAASQNGFVSGLTGGGGIVRRAFNKRFLLDLAEDWQQHGREVFKRVRRESPAI